MDFAVTIGGVGLSVVGGDGMERHAGLSWLHFERAHELGARHVMVVAERLGGVAESFRGPTHVIQ